MNFHSVYNLIILSSFTDNVKRKTLIRYFPAFCEKYVELSIWYKSLLKENLILEFYGSLSIYDYSDARKNGITAIYMRFKGKEMKIEL